MKKVLVKLAKLLNSFVDHICVIKSSTELDHLRKAAEIADQIYGRILPDIKPGISELHIKELFEKAVKESAAPKLAFDLIIAGGPNGAFPHAVPSSRIVVDTDLVVIDFGVIYKGYHSDMTRTLIMSRADDKLRRIYQVVFETQQLILSQVKPGVEASGLDTMAREFMKKQSVPGLMDLDKYFVHGLGHGVGLRIHEDPSLNKMSKYVLKEHMVLTIEPGLYVPGLGGVRIEDTVVVTKDGYELLTKSPKVRV